MKDLGEKKLTFGSLGGFGAAGAAVDAAADVAAVAGIADDRLLEDLPPVGASTAASGSGSFTAGVDTFSNFEAFVDFGAGADFEASADAGGAAVGTGVAVREVRDFGVSSLGVLGPLPEATAGVVSPGFAGAGFFLDEAGVDTSGVDSLGSSAFNFLPFLDDDDGVDVVSGVAVDSAVVSTSKEAA